MNIELPTTPMNGNRELIKSMLVLSRPKVGKTRCLLDLPNSLLIDLEESADYYSGTYINIKKEAKKQGSSQLNTLYEIAKAIKQKNKEKGDYFYDFGIIDTISALEELCENQVTAEYKATPDGKFYKGTSVVTDLDYGKGYLMLRDKLDETLRPFYNLFKTFIIVGHVKDSSISLRGKTLAVTDLNLTGKNKIIIASKCDAIGVMYRDEEKLNNNILSFKTQASDIITGARPAHLANKDFLISELDIETDNLTTHWNKIFTDLKNNS